MGFAKSEYTVSLHSELLCRIDTSNAAIMQETENTHIYMLYLLPAPGFPLQTWQISVSHPIFLSALEAMTKRIWLNFPKAHSTHTAAPRHCGQKFSQQAQRAFHLAVHLLALITRPCNRKKNSDEMQIYLHLNPMKFGKSSPFMQSTLSSAEMLVQSSPASWDIFKTHPTLPQVQDSGVLFLTWALMPCGLWSKNLHCPMHLFLHSYFLLSELPTYFFGTGSLSCGEPVLPTPVHNWLGLMSCLSLSLLEEQRKQSGSPHCKPVCNFLWGRTHIPLMRSSQTDRQTCLKSIMVTRMYTQWMFAPVSCALFLQYFTPSEITLSTKIWWLGWVPWKVNVQSRTVLNMIQTLNWSHKFSEFLPKQ